VESFTNNSNQSVEEDDYCSIVSNQLDYDFLGLQDEEFSRMLDILKYSTKHNLNENAFDDLLKILGFDSNTDQFRKKLDIIEYKKQFFCVKCENLLDQYYCFHCGYNSNFFYYYCNLVDCIKHKLKHNPNFYYDNDYYRFS